MLRTPVLLVVALLVASWFPFGLAGCAAPQEATGPREAPRRVALPAGMPPAGVVDERVRTVQLHRTGEEGSLPVIGLGAGETLTLAFDVLDDGLGGPLSVYFYHADRHWNRTLAPTDYLRGFQRDDLRTYEPSAGPRVRYTHYTYRFPNERIGFLRSGNYVLRVTALGDERAVLVERAFFVSEQAATATIALQAGLGAGGGAPHLQPVAQVRPTARLDTPLFDFDVCFARDGAFEDTRCAGDPALYAAPTSAFFLPRERAFPPPPVRFELDLTVLGAGPRIAEVDLAADPFRVALAPDDARFGTLLVDPALLAGQPLLRPTLRSVARPEVQAEYIRVTFRYVPPGGEPFAGRVVLSGSFNGWATHDRYAMTWVPSEGLYRGEALVKQGRHLYTYVVEERGEAARRAREATRGQPVLYTALVYVRDAALQTDRLVGVGSLVAQQ